MAVKQGFRTSEVSKITGLTQRQLDHWDRTGFLKPSLDPGEGRGKVRLYSFNDLVQLKVVKELRDAGVSLQALRKVVGHLRTAEGLENPLAEARLVVSGSDVILVKSSKELISALELPGQGVLCFVLDVPKMVGELRDSVNELWKTA